MAQNTIVQSETLFSLRKTKKKTRVNKNHIHEQLRATSNIRPYILAHSAY